VAAVFLFIFFYLNFYFLKISKGLCIINIFKELGEFGGPKTMAKDGSSISDSVILKVFGEVCEGIPNTTYKDMRVT